MTAGHQERLTARHDAHGVDDLRRLEVLEQGTAGANDGRGLPARSAWPTKRVA
jgi:hypothetical protein